MRKVLSTLALVLLVVGSAQAQGANSVSITDGTAANGSISAYGTYTEQNGWTLTEFSMTAV